MEGHTENGHIDLYQKLTFTPPPKKKNPLTWFLRKGMKLTIKDKDNFDTI